MSYATMDHAGWVERNMAAMRGMGPKPKRAVTKGPHACPETLTPFQVRVMDILGMVGGGIYNAPIGWSGVHWNFGHGVAVPWRGSLATIDFDKLTRLVLLCCEARIRCEVRPHAFGYLLLCFWQRTGEGPNRAPNVAEAVGTFRAYLPADHRIIHDGPVMAWGDPVV